MIHAAGEAVAPKKKIGERLIEAGLLTLDQLELGLKEQKRTGERIGEILINLGFVNQEQISSVLASEAGVTYLDLDNQVIEPEALKAVPEDLCRKHKLIPVSINTSHITVAMANVFDILAIDEVQGKTGLAVDVVSSTEKALLKSIDQYYGTGISIEEIVQKSLRQVETGRVTEADLAEQAPIVRLVDQIFLEGVNLGATDIHLEPEKTVFRVRYRVDGYLRMGPSLPKALQPGIVARTKIMGGMDIAETRLPQDGKIAFHLGKRKIDLRVSTFPTVIGENVVLRILDKSKLVMGLEQLGFNKKNLEIFKEEIEKPNGIILVTGPTGSGKTTTLYSAISYINSMERNIITLEDPVEYEIPIIRQCQINLKAGLTFGAGLRAILRQDPDVILVGEMRDKETIDMTIRAALTGHLVFSTLHTNDSASSIPRLIDMGVEPFLVSSALNTVIAQRLIRLNCTKCGEEYEPREEVLRASGITSTEGFRSIRGAGCDQCGQTGFRGSLGVFEALRITPEISQMIMDRESSHAILELAREQGFSSLKDDGISKAKKGLTTVEEVMRVGA
jgi:type IV pilus assembly protein PilB